MTFQKKMLDSKIFITAYTERGIVIREEIRMGNFSVSNSASLVVLKRDVVCLLGFFAIVVITVLIIIEITTRITSLSILKYPRICI
jgi:hypothetical protein